MVKRGQVLSVAGDRQVPLGVFRNCCVVFLSSTGVDSELV